MLINSPLNELSKNHTTGLASGVLTFMGGQWIREVDGVVFNLLMVLNNKFTAVIESVLPW